MNNYKKIRKILSELLCPGTEAPVNNRQNLHQYKHEINTSKGQLRNRSYAK